MCSLSAHAQKVELSTATYQLQTSVTSVSVTSVKFKSNHTRVAIDSNRITRVLAGGTFRCRPIRLLVSLPAGRMPEAQP